MNDSEEVKKLKHQLAERDALLLEIRGQSGSSWLRGETQHKLDAALSASAEPSAPKPKYGVLAGEPEIIGERCADGGKCHHMCKTECFRKDGCAPLGGSGLTDDWKEPSAPVERDERALIELALSEYGKATGNHVLPGGINEKQDSFIQGFLVHAALERKP